MTEPTSPPNSPTPETSALDSLNGLSVGDAFGAQFFVPENRDRLIGRQAPPGVWPWTDDTEMACSVHAAWAERQSIDTFDLTHAFARRHDFDRGYGPAANRMLRLIREGGDAKRLAAGLFDGQGSYGNGAAMRVAPLGAAHAHDPAAVVGPAADTAVITHTHPDAVDGAIAVAVAAAYAVRTRTEPTTAPEFLAAVRELTPRGAVRDGIERAIGLLGEPDAHRPAYELGNGSRVSAVDTVPFALWAAARQLDDYRAALWETVRAGGDVDTTAAIVGGIVAARTGTAGIPPAWLAAREPLPDWATPERLAVADFRRYRPEPLSIRLPRSVAVPDLVWPEQSWTLLRRGLRPDRSNHRWVTGIVEGVVYLHEAGTGYGNFEVVVEPVPRTGGWRPVSATAEARPDRFGHPDPAVLLAEVLGMF
ncbi:ADP-ribosylglycohydrolase family protein [Saccharothrix sp. ST-888]|uniref:ADP-ribosylglycohydrolase family protein n=1 Tax=Saccharothrix sp. ST-888 TaxID=1427391 RepID=UPI0007C761F5|nr:ADP-ribosylglycohydrolase family protein [Saccharothrix sp. ST-888]